MFRSQGLGFTTPASSIGIDQREFHGDWQKVWSSFYTVLLQCTQALSSVIKALRYTNRVKNPSKPDETRSKLLRVEKKPVSALSNRSLLIIGGSSAGILSSQTGG